MSQNTLPATMTINLPAVEEQRVTDIARSINLADPALNITYGTETMRNISRFADDLLSRVQAKDAGEVGEKLTDLMVRVKSMDVSEMGRTPGILERLPLIGSLFNSVERTVAKFRTMADQVAVIGEKLEQSMVGLLRDIEVLEQLYRHNEDFYRDLSAYLEAGRRRLEEASTRELPALREMAEASGSALDAQKVRDFTEQINRFERRLHDLELSRTITVQTAPQIRLIQSNNQALAEKIQTSILSTIPIWKSQLVLALSLQGQRDAAAMQKEVSDTTNDLLRRNAAMLQEASVSTAREVERSVVDIETLRDVHAKLVATIEETMRISQEGREKRVAAEKELLGMENELKARLVALADQRTGQEALAASSAGRRSLPEAGDGR